MTQTPEWHVGLKERIAEVIAENDGVGFWHSCSGCHETNEGASTGLYSYSDEFRCEVGSGCRECGGIGVVWDGLDYTDFAEFCAEHDAEQAKTAALEADNAALKAKNEALVEALESLIGGKCPDCKGWGEVAYFGEMVRCKCNGNHQPKPTADQWNKARTALAGAQ